MIKLVTWLSLELKLNYKEVHTSRQKRTIRNDVTQQYLQFYQELRLLF